VSIRAEPPVALVDKVADKRGTRAVAQALIGQHHFRPSDAAAARATRPSTRA